MEENPVVAVDASAGPSGKVPAESEKVIAALLTNPTLAATAQALGVNTSTLWRVMKHPKFKAEYREARRQIVLQAIAQLQHATAMAVETLRGIIGDIQAPAWARINASTAVLQLALKALETEDYDDRLSSLESRLKDLSEEVGKNSDAG